VSIVGLANVVSTVVGIPVAYLAAVLPAAMVPATRGLFGRFPYILGFFEGEPTTHVLGVALAMAPLFYLGSVVVEAGLVRFIISERHGPAELAWKWSWWANAASYVPICAWLAFQTFR